MNTYRSHKEVKAFKIEVITVNRYSSFLQGYAPIGNGETAKVSPDYITKHQPQVGGYYVEYVDGYESYSPAKAFEEGYNLIKLGEIL